MVAEKKAVRLLPYLNGDHPSTHLFLRGVEEFDARGFGHAEELWVAGMVLRQ